jgi:hypothetical protein
MAALCRSQHDGLHRLVQFASASTDDRNDSLGGQPGDRLAIEMTCSEQVEDFAARQGEPMALSGTASAGRPRSSRVSDAAAASSS